MRRRPSRAAWLATIALLPVLLGGIPPADAKPRHAARHARTVKPAKPIKHRPARSKPARQKPRATPVEQLRQAERNQEANQAASQEARDRARAAQIEEQRVAAEQAEAAAQLQDTEQRVAAAAARVEEAAQRQAAARARLTERGQAMLPLLPLAVRLSQFPAETVLAAPLPSEQAVRGLLVLRGLTRQLQRDAVVLRAERQAAQAQEATVQDELAKLREAQAEQAQQSEALDARIAAARDIRHAAEDAGAAADRRAAAEAARAGTLRGVLAEIEAERKRQEVAERQREDAERRRQQAEDRRQREDARALADARDAKSRTALAAASQARDAKRREETEQREQQAALRPKPVPAPNPGRQPFTTPVAGQVVRVWGQPSEGGPSTSLAYRSAPASRVVAPCGGRVVFAGPFRSYGPMLIVDCGGGYHMVLAGLARLDAQVGRPVQAGEPVGVMPGWDPRGAGERPSLYVELRRGGQPVNPAPFLRGRR